MSIEVKNISKTFGSYSVLKDVSLKVDTGAMVALLGPSGCGKTTLLRIIAGLEQPDPGSGAVSFNGEDVTAREVGERRVGFVFQHYALFKHMTIAENVAYGLRVRPRRTRPSAAEITRRVDELLGLVQLSPFGKRYPSQLSGGQRQRVALARALAVEPKVLLLDEPFGALDAKVRKELRQWLRHLHDETGITSVFVTHDQEEALDVADRVAVMNKGIIQQIGAPAEVYDHPVNPLVYSFLGNANRFTGRIHRGRLQIGETDFGDVKRHKSDPSQLAARSGDSDADGRSGIAFVRPHEIDVLREQRNNEPALPAQVQHVSSAGPIARVYLRRTDNGDPIEAELPREKFDALVPQQGEDLYVHLRNLSLYEDEFPATT